MEPGFIMFPLLGPAATEYSLKKQARAFLKGLERTPGSECEAE
jgi:hypothetical protein